MGWFWFALTAMLGWGFADLFYKRGTGEEDPRSHLRIAVWVGLVMGVVALCLLPLSGMRSLGGMLHSAVRYAPASLCYILSMIIGYAGLRYLELSVVSPVQNASGALSALGILAWFLLSGRIAGLGEALSPLDIAGTLLIVAGVMALAVFERRGEAPGEPGERRYTRGAGALIFPLLYCLFDTVGTAADGIILDEETGLGLSEIDVLILYGLTFFAVGVGAYIYLWIREGKPYRMFARDQWPKAAAALCEEAGQVAYVYAMAARPVVAAPMVAAYCAVSVVLSRIFLRERPGGAKYACIAAIIAGILSLGISEGLAA